MIFNIEIKSNKFNEDDTHIKLVFHVKKLLILNIIKYYIYFHAIISTRRHLRDEQNKINLIQLKCTKNDLENCMN